MKIRVTAAPFCDHSLIDESGCMQIKDGASLNELYRLLKIGFVLRPLLLTTVNYDRARPSKRLSEGDEVSIFWPLSGG